MNTSKHLLYRFLPVILALTLWLDKESVAAAQDNEAVRIQTGWSVDRARPGDTIALAIVLNITEGYHINADASQIKPLKDFKPYPTNVRVIAAHEGLTIEAPRFPEAHPVKVAYAGGNLMSFDGKTIVFVPMQVEASVTAGFAELELLVQYQACAAAYCLFPQKISVKEKILIVEPTATVAGINAEIFARFAPVTVNAVPSRVRFDLFGWGFSIDVSSRIGWSVFFFTAALGGLLLNFTPCVLPIIPIKIISLSQVSPNQGRCVALGLSTCLGVLLFWMALGAMIAMISEFTAANQFFHYPLFTIAVGIIMATMAVGMFGLFSVRLPRFIYMIDPQQNSLTGSFALGILAAILSTPCTAPFMGAAAAWATTQTPLVTLVTFSAIGFGMALPYLVLSAAPAWAKKMPQTGPASEVVKQLMGVFMLAAAAYFLGVGVCSVFSEPPDPPSKLYWWPVMGFIFAGGIWLIYRTFQISVHAIPKAVFTCLGLIMMAASAFGAVNLTDKGPIDWVYYTPRKFDESIQQKKVVVMIFTAEWCLNCRVLEESVLNSPEISKLLTTPEVVPIKVDITGKNPSGKAKLKEVGNLTIPLLVIYSPNGNQVFKSDFYTVDQISRAVNAALEKKITK